MLRRKAVKTGSSVSFGQALSLVSHAVLFNLENSRVAFKAVSIYVIQSIDILGGLAMSPAGCKALLAPRFAEVDCLSISLARKVFPPHKERSDIGQ